ncbi:MULTISPECIES: hypothetical protein [unclassified Microcoleus]|uniref:hypothetical protein n=1 Tax=unclassified Microcoleus TaxID=2642155 RepID=UPI002FD6CC32
MQERAIARSGQKKITGGQPVHLSGGRTGLGTAKPEAVGSCTSPIATVLDSYKVGSSGKRSTKIYA